MNEGTVSKCKAEKLQAGDVFSRSSYGTIVAIGHSHVTVKNTEGRMWDVSKAIIEDEFQMAGHVYTDSEKVSRTQLIELIRANPRTAMTITFNKKVDHKVVANELSQGQSALTPRQFTSKVKKALEGEVRTVRGVHHNALDEHGRLLFTIIGEEKGNGLRLVDPRTISQVIVNNTEYLVK